MHEAGYPSRLPVETERAPTWVRFSLVDQESTALCGQVLHNSAWDT